MLLLLWRLNFLKKCQNYLREISGYYHRRRRREDHIEDHGKNTILMFLLYEIKIFEVSDYCNVLTIHAINSVQFEVKDSNVTRFVRIDSIFQLRFSF